MKNWVVMRKGAPFQEIGEKFHIHPVIARLIRNREIVGDEAIDMYLHGTISDLHDGMLMKDMDKAVDILLEKIAGEKKIRIIGDYDIDGVNATYILMEGIGTLGGIVDSDIPNRMKDGYGLNQTLIERAYEDGIDTIVTCDNGIAARDAISYGKKLGMTIVVTDHHEVPFEETEGERRYIIPDADAVVDPKQQDCPYPFKELCGAAVAYKLVEALFEASGKDAEDVDYLLENVAIATVGDVMDLTGENRIFVKQGLEMLERTSNMGLRSLMILNGIDGIELSPYHIGFVLGPCLNAGGRLDTAKRALDLLLAQDKKDADILAGDLKALNESRKEMTAIAVEQAIAQVENSRLKEDTVLVVYLPECHESLAGIVAGKVRERYYKPTIVLTDGEEGLKGSGRSVEAYHMYDGLNACGHLLTKFGGHKLAAGLSLEKENLAKFRRLINEQSNLTPEDLTEKISIDMPLPFSYLSMELTEELKLLEPFGKGNSKPIFAQREVEIFDSRIFGKNENVLKMRMRDGDGGLITAVYFGDAKGFLSYYESRPERKIAITFYPEISEFRGQRELQIIVQDYK